MPHKTAALMRFSSGSQAAAKRNPHSISAEWLVVPGFWFLAPGPGFWSLVPGSLAALSASNHRHIILLSSGSQTAQLAQEPFSRLSRFPLFQPFPAWFPFCGRPHAAGYWPSRGFE